jgi:hypothetical protein
VIRERERVTDLDRPGSMDDPKLLDRPGIEELDRNT